MSDMALTSVTAVTEPDLSVILDLSDRNSDDELSPDLLSTNESVKTMDRSNIVIDDIGSISVKKPKKYMSRRLSSIIHIPTTNPHVGKVDTNSLSTSQMNELKSLIASFPDVPTDIIQENSNNHNYSNTIISSTSSAIKAVSSGWGAMRGFFNNNKDNES